MAFAPPRRVNTRTADHRKRTEIDSAKNHQKIRTVIETRHRAWLSDKASNNAEFSDTDQNIRVESTRLTQEMSVYQPAAQQTEILQVSDVNCSNLEGAFSYGYPGILKSKKELTSMNGKSDERTSNLTSDYLASINKFKISKTSSGSNVYNAKPKLGYKPEKTLREMSVRSDGGEPMTTAELRRKADELLNQAKASLHRYGRESRPESHFCPLCRRMMGLEGHHPICIIPCGHSVCEPCSKNLKKTCTICDHDIQTTTSNIVLKRIIAQFSEERGLEPRQDTSVKANHIDSSESRSVHSLSQRLDEIQQNRKSYLSDGTQDDSAYMLPETNRDFSATKRDLAATNDDLTATSKAPSAVQPPTSFQSSEVTLETKPRLNDISTRISQPREGETVQNTAIIPKIANINKQLTNLLKPYCEQPNAVTVPKLEGKAKIEEKETVMFEDFPDYKPSEADLKKWTGELAAVEMRISVMELQARQTTTAISNIDARITGAKDTLELLDQREHQLLESLKFTKLQLKETDMERSKIMQQINNDHAESERCCEQLNLINYTRAGLEAELDKLRLLCNRAS